MTKRNRQLLRLSADAATRLALITAAWQTAHPGIEPVGVVERLIAEEEAGIDRDIDQAEDRVAAYREPAGAAQRLRTLQRRLRVLEADADALAGQVAAAQVAETRALVERLRNRMNEMESED